MTSQNMTKESEPAVSMDTNSIVTMGRGGKKRKQVGGIKKGGIKYIYIYIKIYFLVLEDFVLNERCTIPFYAFDSMFKNTDKFTISSSYSKC